MAHLNTYASNQSFRNGMVVAPAGELMGVQSPDGGLVPCERLGPGIVEQVSTDGRIRVRWVEAGFDALMDPQDLRSYGEHVHLVVIYRCDGRGNNIKFRSKIVEKAGLEYNWTVELRPNNVVRTVRADGCAWTFKFKPIIRRLEAAWPWPPEDEDAEALTVAELSVY